MLFPDRPKLHTLVRIWRKHSLLLAMYRSDDVVDREDGSSAILYPPRTSSTEDHCNFGTSFPPQNSAQRRQFPTNSSRTQLDSYQLLLQRQLEVARHSLIGWDYAVATFTPDKPKYFDSHIEFTKRVHTRFDNIAKINWKSGKLSARL